MERGLSKIIKDKCKYKFNAYRYYGVRKEGIDLHGQVNYSDEDMLPYIKIYNNNK